MCGVARHTTLLAAACFGMALPLPVAAENGNYRQAIIDDWSAFIAFCTPFLEDPIKAQNALPIHPSGMTIAQTDDGMAYEYNHAPAGYELHTGASLYTSGGEVHFDCNTFRSLNALFAQPVALSQAFEQLLAQTDTIKSSGGRVNYSRMDSLEVAQLSDAQNMRYSYALENVFPGNRTYVSVELSYFSLSFHVSGTFDEVDGLK